MPLKKDRILFPLETLLRSKFTIEAERMLTFNICKSENHLLDYLENIAIERIVAGKRSIPFSALLKKQPELLLILSEADNYYQLLFDNDNLIHPSSRDQSSPNPMSNLFKAIYNLFQGSRCSFDENLGIYCTFRDYYLKKICTRLVSNPIFNKLEHWSKLKGLLSRPNFHWDEWLDNIPTAALKAEKSKFGGVNPTATFYELAEPAGFGKSTLADARKYVKSFKEMDRSDLLSYVQKTSTGSDYLHYKKDITFNLALCELLGAEVWLKLVHALKYPNLQDHAFLFLRSIDFYLDIFEVLAKSGKQYDEDLEVLSLISLQNFIEHIFKIGADLLGFQKKDNFYDHLNCDQVLAQADGLSKEWFGDRLPDIFKKILNDLFPGGLLSGEFGMYFIRWFYGYKITHISTPYDSNRNHTLDVLNNTFRDFFYADSRNISFILNNYNIDYYNWEVFDLLTSNPSGKIISKQINKKILDLHLGYIRSKKFQWNRDKEFNNKTAKEGYRFSQLLFEQNDFLDKWNALYLEFRLYHEGWHGNHGWSNEELEKECYILTSGIGLAYRLYLEERNHEARDLLTIIFSKTLNQARLTLSFDLPYISPIAFALHTFKEHDQEILHNKVELFESKTDNLRQLLIVLAVVYNKEGPMVPKQTKSIIRKRIREDYFILENKFNDPVLRHQLEYFNELKEVILGSFKKG
jgi:hypothetical protein